MVSITHDGHNQSAGKHAALPAGAKTGETKTGNCQVDSTAKPDSYGIPTNSYAGSAHGGADHSAPTVFGKSVSSSKIAKIAGAVVAGTLALIYLVGIGVFSCLFYPNSTIGKTDISFSSARNVSAILSDMGSTYKVRVSGDGLNFTIDGDDARIAVDCDAVAKKALSDNKPWQWPYQVFQEHDETENIVATYDETGFDGIVNEHIDAFNETATDPIDATITFSALDKAFVVSPEELGTKIDSDAVIEAITKAIINMQSEVKLGEQELVQPMVFRDNPKLAQAADTANSYLKADFELVLDSIEKTVQEIGPAQVAQWVTVDENLDVTFDENQILPWAKEVAASICTVGASRTFTGADGRTHSVSGGTYGWDVDTQALVGQIQEGIINGRTDPLSVPTVQEGYTWDSATGVDWGPHVEVSIAAQHAWYVSASGEVLWDADVVTGSPNRQNATPTGVFRILNKQRNVVLRGTIDKKTGKPEYESPVAYWMPFTYSGCGFHDAPWQSAFGGSRYRDGFGSHGCVNLSNNSARTLYDVAATGNAVVVYGW